MKLPWDETPIKKVKYPDRSSYVVVEDFPLNEEDNLLKIVYENGEFPNRITLTEIRNKLNEKV